MFRLLPLFVALASMAAPSAARAAWQRAESSHFVIYSDDRPERVKTFADRLERFDGATRVALKLNDPSRTESQKLTVYMLRDIDAVARLARMGSAAGFYHSRASGSVAFLPRQTEASAWWSPQTEAIFFHEYAHHLQLQFSSVALPLWTREGFAEFFATADVRKDGSVAIGGVPVYRAYGLLSGQGISVQSMVGATYGRLDPMQMDSIYGQGWLLTHYLTFNDARKGQLNRYVGDIQKGMTPLDAAKDAFGDLKKLADELNKYRSQRLVGVIVPAARIAVAKIEVRALTAGQAALMPVHLRSTRGVTLQAAPALAAQARQLAAPSRKMRSPSEVSPKPSSMLAISRPPALPRRARSRPIRPIRTR